MAESPPPFQFQPLFGVQAVREKLREYLRASANGHTIILHEMIAVLMMSLSQNKLVTTKHNQVNYA